MAALPSPRSRNFPQENVPLSAVKPIKGVMTEPAYCTFQSTAAEIPSTTLIEDDFWGYLNFVLDVDLSLEFPTSPSVYRNISTDDCNVNSKPARVKDWMSPDEETLSYLETAVSTTSKRIPAEMKETLRKENSNTLPLRNFHPSISVSESSAQKNVPEVPDAKCYCQGNWHTRHGEEFTCEIENSVCAYISLHYLFQYVCGREPCCLFYRSICIALRLRLGNRITKFLEQQPLPGTNSSRTLLEISAS